MALHPFDAFKVEKELAADGVDDGAMMSEGEPRAAAHQARFQQWIVHAGNGFHSQDEWRIEAAESSSSRRARKMRSWPSSWKV